MSALKDIDKEDRIVTMLEAFVSMHKTDASVLELYKTMLCSAFQVGSALRHVKLQKIVGFALRQATLQKKMGK